MAGDSINDTKSFSDKASDFRDAAVTTARDASGAAVSTADDYRDSLTSSARDLGESATAAARDVQDKAGSLVDTLKSQASQHAGDAKDIVSNIASEARNKIAEIVDQQKSAGAEKLSSLSRAAQTAAGDLDEQNPQVARLVRDAASSVDRFAGELRSSDLSEVVATVSGFARRQPVAFFAGSVLAGFILARFLKSEPTASYGDYPNASR